MPTSPFVELAGWTIDEWNPDLNDEVPEGIPVNCFQTQATTMLIGLESNATSTSFTLMWLDQSGKPCFVSGLQPDPPSDLEAPGLEGRGLTVHFGEREVVCDLFLAVNFIDSEKGLSGSITIANPEDSGVLGPETGTGTFTATANGGPGAVDTGAASTRRPT